MPQVLFTAQNTPQLINYCLSILNNRTTVEAEFRALNFASHELLPHLVNNNDVFQAVFSQCIPSHLLSICIERLDQDEDTTALIFDASQIIAHNPHLDLRTLIRTLPVSLVSYVVDTINDTNPDIVRSYDLKTLFINNEEFNIMLVNYFEAHEVQQSKYIFHRVAELKHIDLMVKLSEYNIDTTELDDIKNWSVLDYYLYCNYLSEDQFKQGLLCLRSCPITNQTITRIQNLNSSKRDMVKQLYNI
jgi:hypothetical protein